jgi:hypothetical protein
MREKPTFKDQPRFEENTTKKVLMDERKEGSISVPANAGRNWGMRNADKMRELGDPGRLLKG